MHDGHAGWGAYLYDLYGPPTCHQLPERSYFLFGPSATYSLSELEALTGGDGAAALRRQWGDRLLGLCQRCLAIYVTLFLAGSPLPSCGPGCGRSL